MYRCDGLRRRRRRNKATRDSVLNEEPSMGKLITNLAFITMISTPAIAMAKATHSPEVGVGILGAALAAGVVQVFF
ncbi:hypothetical protein B1812_03930 [Methylocystis bryophila]|uniref:Uncharacterized protein n=1 Tax=Methylocystis bryophila TaxID=655015 RepID=A0A1W6MS97_9HYPH|nr:hypothetical protein B1812_03930 [Methylocystis bryophila]